MKHPLDTTIFDLVVQDLADPAPGILAGLTSPTNARILVVAVRLVLVTSAGGANRTVHLHYTDGTLDLFVTPAPAVQTASSTREFNFAIGSGGPFVGATDDERVTPLPSQLFLGPNFTLDIDVTNIQAGDQLSEIVYTYQKWFNPI
jgi:hypothetical protein